MTPWKFCLGCRQKEPIPECPLCETLNGRRMTDEEFAAMNLAARKTWEAANPGWWLDVPFPDDTTPRERRQK